MQNGNDFQQCPSPIHDHILIHAEEEHIAAREIGTSMAFSRKTSKALECVHQFFLNPISYGQPCFSEQITPNLPEIVFSFRRNEVMLHVSERSLSHAALSA